MKKTLELVKGYDAAAMAEHGLTDPNSDALKGLQLTEQYHRATGGMKEVIIFGAMMMQLRETYPEIAKKGGDRKSKSTVDFDRMTLARWLETYAPQVKRTTALRFLHVTEAISSNYAEIVGAKVAKLISLPDLVTKSAAELPAGCEAKQLELFEFVNGTSQRSWLDMFSPESPQKRGHKTKQEQGNDKPRPKTDAEICQEAEDELVNVLNLLDGWFLAAHHTRVKVESRKIAEATLEEALKKVRGVKA